MCGAHFCHSCAMKRNWMMVKIKCYNNKFTGLNITDKKICIRLCACCWPVVPNCFRIGIHFLKIMPCWYSYSFLRLKKSFTLSQTSVFIIGGNHILELLLSSTLIKLGPFWWPCSSLHLVFQKGHSYSRQNVWFSFTFDQAQYIFSYQLGQ